MLPKAIEIKAKEAIDRIEQGSFTEDDIELVLIRLREYSSGKSIFREISHFIAHHRRDSGLTFISLYRVYCRMRAYGEFQYHKKPLDLKSPIDKWFYDFVIFQLEEIESHNLKKKYGISRKQAKRTFKEFFSEENGVYSCIKQPSQELLNIVNEAASFIKMKPLFTCDEIIQSFCDTFKSLGLVTDTKSIEAKANQLIIALLVTQSIQSFKA